MKQTDLGMNLTIQRPRKRKLFDARELRGAMKQSSGASGAIRAHVKMERPSLSVKNMLPIHFT